MARFWFPVSRRVRSELKSLEDDAFVSERVVEILAERCKERVQLLLTSCYLPRRTTHLWRTAVTSDPDVCARPSKRWGRGGPRHMGLVASAVMAGAAILVAACGGPARPQSVAHLGKNPPTPTTVAAAPSGAFPNLQRLYQQSLAYAGCMRTHGEPNYPDPVLVNNNHEKTVTMPGNVDQNSPQYRAANSACKHLLPNDGNGPTQAQVQQGMATLVKAAECMRSHGVPNFPDPTESSGGRAIGFQMKGVDPNTQQFRAAQKACRSLSPLLGGA